MTTTGGTGQLSGAAALHDLFILDSAQIDALAWQPVPGRPGVRKKELWRLGDYTQALIHYEPGASTPGEPLLAAHQHVWLLNGSARIAGRQLTGSAYLHIPPGVRHAVTDVGPGGATLLQMHRPHAPVEAEALAHADESSAVDFVTGERIESAAIAELATDPRG